MVRILLPYHLRTLAAIDDEARLDVAAPVTIGSILNALEAKYPMLRGTIREHVTYKRRPLIRFFACEEDWSHASPDQVLPHSIAAGVQPFWIVGAIAGG
jgi:hypothetical protein